MVHPPPRRQAKKISSTPSSGSLSTSPKSARHSTRLQENFATDDPRSSVAKILLIRVIHDSGAGSKSYSKSNHHSRTRPLVFLSQHKTGRRAREVAVTFKHLVGAVNFLGLRVQVELRTNAVQNLLAARMNQAIVYLGQIRNW